MTSKDLGAFVADYRFRHNMSLRYLAKVLKITPSNLHKLEKGQVRPLADLAIRVMELVGFDLDTQYKALNKHLIIRAAETELELNRHKAKNDTFRRR